MITIKSLLIFFIIVLLVSFLLQRDLIKALMMSVITTMLYGLVIYMNNKSSS